MSELGERVYFQYQPDSEAQAVLDAKNECIADELGGTAISTSEYHFTAFHFGTVDGVFNLLKRISQGRLTESTYIEALQSFQDEVSIALPAAVDVHPVAYQKFGNPKAPTRKLALMVEPGPDFIKAQRNTVHLFTGFLRRCGITGGLNFMRRSTNFWAAVHFNPHIIVRNGITQLPTSPPPRDILHMDFVAPWYDLAHDRHAANTQD